MRILIDECLDWRLKREFAGRHAAAVGDMGWSGMKNGALLTLAQPHFDVFINADKNLLHQQNIANFTIAVIVLDVVSTRLLDCLSLIPKVLAILPQVQAGSVYLVQP